MEEKNGRQRWKQKILSQCARCVTSSVSSDRRRHSYLCLPCGATLNLDPFREIRAMQYLLSPAIGLGPEPATNCQAGEHSQQLSSSVYLLSGTQKSPPSYQEVQPLWMSPTSASHWAHLWVNFCWYRECIFHRWGSKLRVSPYATLAKLVVHCTCPVMTFNWMQRIRPCCNESNRVIRISLACLLELSETLEYWCRIVALPAKTLMIARAQTWWQRL